MKPPQRFDGQRTDGRLDLTSLDTLFGDLKIGQATEVQAGDGGYTITAVPATVPEARGSKRISADDALSASEVKIGPGEYICATLKKGPDGVGYITFEHKGNTYIVEQSHEQVGESEPVKLTYRPIQKDTGGNIAGLMHSPRQEDIL